MSDWQAGEVLPVNLLYPPSVRRIPRVRLFIDFVVQPFADIEQQREVRAPDSAAPAWLRGHRAKASAGSLVRP